MIESFYRAIRKDAPPQIVSVGGRSYTDKPLYPVQTPVPGKLLVNNLTSIVDYIKTNVDGLDVASLICHIESPSVVSIKSHLMGDFKDRATYIMAELDQLLLPFNAWLEREKFNIWLQSCFEDPEGRAVSDKGLVLKYIGNIKSVVENTLSDDGVSQAVTVASGIASVKNVVLPNPVILRPFRTFVEVDQPASRFIFRTRTAGDEMEFMLVEADGGAWRGEAMQNIKDFMRNAVPELSVIA